jgi:hypothetical protein
MSVVHTWNEKKKRKFIKINQTYHFEQIHPKFEPTTWNQQIYFWILSEEANSMILRENENVYVS